MHICKYYTCVFALIKTIFDVSSNNNCLELGTPYSMIARTKQLCIFLSKNILQTEISQIVFELGVSSRWCTEKKMAWLKVVTR